jgi:hypothetical protein
MASGDTFRVRMRGTLRASTIEFGVHINQTAGTTGAAELAAHWAANVTPLVTAATSAEVNWDEVIVSDVNPLGKRSVHVALTQPLPGLILGDCLPGQNSLVVQLNTNNKGRGTHGRFYLPGISETYSSNGQVTGAQLTAAQALGNGLENFYGPGGTFAGFRLAIYSPEQLNPPRVRPFKPRPGTIVQLVEDTRVDPIIRTTRRRAIGVGR